MATPTSKSVLDILAVLIRHHTHARRADAHTTHRHDHNTSLTGCNVRTEYLVGSHEEECGGDHCLQPAGFAECLVHCYLPGCYR